MALALEFASKPQRKMKRIEQAKKGDASKTPIRQCEDIFHAVHRRNPKPKKDRNAKSIVTHPPEGVASKAQQAALQLPI